MFIVPTESRGNFLYCILFSRSLRHCCNTDIRQPFDYTPAVYYGLPGTHHIIYRNETAPFARNGDPLGALPDCYMTIYICHPKA